MAETCRASVRRSRPSKGLVARLGSRLFAAGHLRRRRRAAACARARSSSRSLMIGASTAFFSTDVGRQATLDRQDRTIQSFGVRLNDAQYARMQQRMNSPLTRCSAASACSSPCRSWRRSSPASSRRLQRGDRRRRHVQAGLRRRRPFAACSRALQHALHLPLDYVRESLSSPTNLGVFLPFLDETRSRRGCSASIDLFYIWWIVNLAIGLGVLYKRRTAPIADDDARHLRRDRARRRRRQRRFLQERR